jgi:acyl-CoA thioester hydrolase
VNAPTTIVSPRLENYPHQMKDNVRFADLDANQHVNNAIYATYFEAGRVTLTKDPAIGLTPEGLSWVMVRLDIHFRAELHWPAAIQLGLGISRVGRTSLGFEQAVFSAGKCIASAQAVTVLIDQLSRKPTPLTPAIIAKLQPWMMRETLTS